MQLRLFPDDPGRGAGQRWRAGDAAWAHPTLDRFDPARYTVAPIAEADARQFIVEHHYTAGYPAARLRYGLIEAATGAVAGVAVLSVPMTASVLTRPFPTLVPYVESLELGRFVLLDEVGYCGETWFLTRVFRLAAAAGIRGVVSYSDPMARTTAAGRVVFAGHIGGIYQAANAVYCGRSTRRQLILLPDGAVLSARAISKVRRQDTGHDYVERLLVHHGARPPAPNQAPTAWLRDALDTIGARAAVHPGNHRYCFRLGTPAQRRAVRLGLVADAYPKHTDHPRPRNHTTAHGKPSSRPGRRTTRPDPPRTDPRTSSAAEPRTGVHPGQGHNGPVRNTVTEAGR